MKPKEEGLPMMQNIYMTQESAREFRLCLKFIRSKRNAILHLELLALRKYARFEEYPTSSTVESLQSTDLESVIDINVISPSDDSIPDTEQPEPDPELYISFLYEENPEPSTRENLQSPSNDTEQPEADPELDISFLYKENPEPSTKRISSLQATIPNNQKSSPN